MAAKSSDDTKRNLMLYKTSTDYDFMKFDTIRTTSTKLLVKQRNLLKKLVKLTEKSFLRSMSDEFSEHSSVTRFTQLIIAPPEGSCRRRTWKLNRNRFPLNWHSWSTLYKSLEISLPPQFQRISKHFVNGDSRSLFTFNRLIELASSTCEKMTKREKRKNIYPVHHAILTFVGFGSHRFGTDGRTGDGREAAELAYQWMAMFFDFGTLFS